MAPVVNLRMARKQKNRQDKDKKAAENRVRFGQTKAEKQHVSAIKNIETRKFQGKKLSPDPDTK